MLNYFCSITLLCVRMKNRTDFGNRVPIYLVIVSLKLVLWVMVLILLILFLLEIWKNTDHCWSDFLRVRKKIRAICTKFHICFSLCLLENFTAWIVVQGCTRKCVGSKGRLLDWERRRERHMYVCKLRRCINNICSWANLNLMF